MKNVTNYFISLASPSPDGSFGVNTNILLISIINISVVLGVLIVFGRGILSDFIENRKNRIVNTFQISEDLYSGAVEKLEKARDFLCKVEMEIAEFRVTGCSEIERDKLNLINSTYNTLEQLEKKKKETCWFEKQRAITEVRQWVLQQTFQRVLETLNIFLDNELHLRTISVNISLLATVKEIEILY
uniref:ATP synthase CF0 subunit I n=1 Tax=Cuscuta polyanthemos TaxID=437288 RepID=UPI00243498EF|nr:ATP synthase CF0 subunit I [Cuscuta polyanthemos]WEY30484.1 ATP synthase CF0 subunit I [Cuscuta polyanthemos]